MSERIAELARKLQPYILGWVKAGGADGGGMAVHDLSGAFHTGTLADDQAPQFLKVDGSRALTGNLAVGEGVTIDGVDLSVHAGNPAAHHTWPLTDAEIPDTHTHTPGSIPLGALEEDVATQDELDAHIGAPDPHPVYGRLEDNETVTGVWNFENGLNAGTTVLIVNAGQENVGINRSPDPQFALDVNGPARATYWIGPHAIQLDGALMIAHYDGPQPYEVNFAGNAKGHMGQAATATGGIVYRPGRFGKAIQVAPGTTNLITNPVCEVGTAGWYNSNLTVFGRVTASPYIGTGNFYASVTSSSGSGEYAYTADMTVTAGSAYALQMMIRKTVPGGRISVWWYDASSHLGGDDLDLETGAHDDWTLYTLKATAPAGATRARVVVNPRLGVGQSGVIEFDAVQFEQKNYATPFAYGDMPGHSWAGTAHESTSTRPGAVLKYAMEDVGLDPRKGSISMWVKQIDVNTDAGFLWSAGNATGEFDAYIASNGNVYFRENANSVGGTPTDLTQWTHFVFTWDVGGNAITIYENGAYLASRTYSAITLGAELGVGHLAGNNTRYDANAWIDDFVVLDRVLGADEVRAVYESDAPVFAETSTWSWQSPGADVWLDSVGLWFGDGEGLLNQDGLRILTPTALQPSDVSSIAWVSEMGSGSPDASIATRYVPQAGNEYRTMRLGVATTSALVDDPYITIEASDAMPYSRVILEANKLEINTAMIEATGDPHILGTRGYGCTVYRTSTQSVGTATWTNMLFNAEFTDAPGMWSSGAPAQITIKSKGTYIVSAHIAFDAHSTGVRILEIMWNDGGTTRIVADQRSINLGPHFVHLSVTAVVPDCEPNDYFYFRMYQDSGGNLNTAAGSATELRNFSASVYRIP